MAYKAFDLSGAPTRRWGQPEDFGAIAVCLARDASGYRAGETFPVDDGDLLF